MLSAKCWPFCFVLGVLTNAFTTPVFLRLQIYPDGIRHIRADKRVNEWKTPGKKSIIKCAVNQRQVVIALTGGELVYFEMDPVSEATTVLFTQSMRIWL